jgi:hypothetical protein
VAAIESPLHKAYMQITGTEDRKITIYAGTSKQITKISGNIQSVDQK